MRAVFALALLVLGVVGGWLLVRGDVPCDVLALQPDCEVAVMPGPAQDTVSLITIDEATSYAPEGQLLLTTIAVQDELDLRTWFRARTSGVIDAVPRETIFPPGADVEQVAETNAAMMADSQLTATIAGLSEAGYDVTGEGALVVAVSEDAVTDALRPGDVIVAVDDAPVTGSGEAVEAVGRGTPGETVRFALADGREVPVELGSSPDDPDRPFVGVLLTTEVELPVDVTIDAGAIGGPSAGLLFALGIVELLGPEDLTGGRIVAGTGTMARDGTVGSVGGIRQKVVGATSPEGGGPAAEVFLVPEDNFAEARRASVDRDVLLIPVDTLERALAALAALRDGRDPDGAVLLAAGR